MEVRVNKSTETVEWVVSGRTICIHNQYALYAFTQRDYLIKVKELHGQSRSGFSAYDKDGELIFSFSNLREPNREIERSSEPIGKGERMHSAVIGIRRRNGSF